ncbi:hypothetical protein ACFOD4_17135 [Pseudoroseomonas globiformis]|uniref:Uncharacterized protein n=1 Tax=Teichococcus globiformis TaxID=2307229 RepID=A0ABV7G846_9PROT
MPVPVQRAPSVGRVPRGRQGYVSDLRPPVEKGGKMLRLSLRRKPIYLAAIASA